MEEIWFSPPVFWVHVVLRGILHLLWGVLFCSSGRKREMAWRKNNIWFSNSFFSFFSFLNFFYQGWLQHQGAPGFCGAARVRRPQPRPSTTVSWMFKPNIKQNSNTATCAPWLLVASQIKSPFLSLSFFVVSVGSSCGVSVCQVKPRRLTVWWRRLPRGIASATPGSSSQQVSHTAGHCSAQNSCLYSY